MITHDLIQGSPEWLAYRAQMRNASDAPAMMGCSIYKTRAELLREMHTGVAAEVDIGTQKRFDNGHRAEALARPLAEEFIGAELYPVTGSLGNLSTSFDGITLDESTCYEHKALNDALRAAFSVIAALGPADDAAPGHTLPLMYRVQMEQQLLVSGAERVLFMASSWTPADELIEEQHCWYYPDASLRQQIVDGWRQFERDLAEYAMPASAAAAPAGKAPQTLPALRIEVTGQVTASNLAEFKQTALAAIQSVNRTLTTDADFADASASITWCSDVESRLKAAKEHALSQTASIDALFKTIDDISAEARRVRLDLNTLVTRRKTEVKEEAVSAARKALDAHIATLNAELAPMRLQTVLVDFPGAIKGLRSISSMQDALDTMLAGGKIVADQQARGIRANIAAFKAAADGLEFLFADLGVLVYKAADDFAAVLQNRIDAHRAAEAEKVRKAAEAEAQRIAQAEQRAREQEAARIAEQQRQADAAAADSKRQFETAVAVPLMPAVVPRSAPTVPPVAVIVPPPVANERADLTLGNICNRLGFSVSGSFLADVLHIKPAATNQRASLFTETQYQTICRQLQSHVSAMAELYAGETA